MAEEMCANVTNSINDVITKQQRGSMRISSKRKIQKKEIKRHLISTIRADNMGDKVNLTVNLENIGESFDRDSLKIDKLDYEAQSCRKIKHKKRNKVKQIEDTIKTATKSFKDNLDGFGKHNENDKTDGDQETTKPFYSSRKDFDNLSSILQKIKATPKHMVDYKNNLEQSMFKKKLGLERIDKFQYTLLQANIDQRSSALPKLRENSVGVAPYSENRISFKFDKDIKEELNKSQNAANLNSDLIQNINKKNRIKLRELKQPDLNHKNSQSFHYPNSTRRKTINKKMIKRYKLKPLDTSGRIFEDPKSKSPLQTHLKQLSNIIGGDDEFKTAMEPLSSVTARTKINLEKLNRSVPKASPKMVRGGKISVERQRVEEKGSAGIKKFINSPKFPLKCSPFIVPEEKEREEVNRIDGINFMNILMYINGEDQGVNIANDQQFQEICKLMDEYYGLSERKILNKYEIWKKYIKNLQMKKNFDERSREDSGLAFQVEANISKDEMVKRYSAYLSKKWFSDADPFLKAKYKKFFEDSEVKWGPNMVFKKLAKETDKVNKIKGLVEKRLDKEALYVNNRIKVDNVKAERKQISTSETSGDEEYDRYINLPHSDTCKYCRLDQAHAHHQREFSEAPVIKMEKIKSDDSEIAKSNRPEEISQITDSRSPHHQNESLQKLHRQLSFRFSN
ncbi:unnamed protein product [Moneuplotes crassus]|uniref:Uncharacterized protein n=2 Tax=Euplotes crassus TaxID=5936 RepID=A0AAD2DCH5_EUPCR|nr:unnamed protein product [Moneuplotes crassus]